MDVIFYYYILIDFNLKLMRYFFLSIHVCLEAEMMMLQVFLLQDVEQCELHHEETNNVVSKQV